MTHLTFAVYADGPQDHQPMALFAELEDAIEWALRRLGSDRFSIRHVAVRGGAGGPATTGPQLS